MPDLTHTPRHWADALRAAFARGGWLVVLAFMVAGLVFTATASAHTITEDQAIAAAKRHGQKKVAQPDNSYIRSRVISCTRLYPHQFRCKIGYDTRRTRNTSRWACVERVTSHYKHHEENTGTRVFVDAWGHEC